MDYVDGNNRRRHPRYDTDMKLLFKVKYDINVKVEFQVLEGYDKGNINRRYSGACNNVSVDGLLIVSNKSLTQGNILMLEVYDPILMRPVKMEGHVRWCEKSDSSDQDKGEIFRAGVQVLLIDGKSVSDSIYFDNKYMVAWSALLESLFGTFAALKKYPMSPDKRKEPQQ